MIGAHPGSPADDDAVGGEGLEAEPCEAGDVAAAGDGGQDGVLVVGLEEGFVGEDVRGGGKQMCEDVGGTGQGVDYDVGFFDVCCLPDVCR